MPLPAPQVDLLIHARTLRPRPLNSGFVQVRLDAARARRLLDIVDRPSKGTKPHSTDHAAGRFFKPRKRHPRPRVAMITALTESAPPQVALPHMMDRLERCTRRSESLQSNKDGVRWEAGGKSAFRSDRVRADSIAEAAIYLLDAPEARELLGRMAIDHPHRLLEIIESGLTPMGTDGKQVISVRPLIDKEIMVRLMRSPVSEVRERAMRLLGSES